MAAVYNVEWLCLLCTVFMCAWRVYLTGMFGIPFFFVIPCDVDIAIVNRLCTETFFYGLKVKLKFKINKNRDNILKKGQTNGLSNFWGTMQE